jgi:hypothetical protein
MSSRKNSRRAAQAASRATAPSGISPSGESKTEDSVSDSEDQVDASQAEASSTTAIISKLFKLQHQATMVYLAILVFQLLLLTFQY